MGDFIRLLIEIAQYVWPFRIIWQYEQGALYVFGRFRKTLGPGCYPLIPFFMEIKTDGVVSHVTVMPVQTIETKDGTTLTFSATITLEVTNLGDAYNKVMDWQVSAAELAAAALSERLAEVEPEQLAPERRGRLIGGLKQSINNRLEAFGVRATELRFNNFVRKMRVYRLINEQHYPNPS